MKQVLPCLFYTSTIQPYLFCVCTFLLDTFCFWYISICYSQGRIYGGGHGAITKIELLKVSLFSYVLKTNIIRLVHLVKHPQNPGGENAPLPPPQDDHDFFRLFIFIARVNVQPPRALTCTTRSLHMGCSFYRGITCIVH